MTQSLAQRAESLAAGLAGLDLEGRIRLVERAVQGRLVFTTSLGIEDQVLTHAIALAKGGPKERIEIVTLDTGRLFPETYDVWAETESAYGIRIRAYAPERKAEEAFVASAGINGFRHSVAARQACCGFRKVEPLGRALDQAAIWFTGLRAGQSANRAETPLAEADEQRGLIKVNPLADWTRARIDAFVKDNFVPYNVLHDRGFPSIGCAPCTRPVRIGEDERAGRWWWEQESKKECGLHVHAPDGSDRDASPRPEGEGDRAQRGGVGSGETDSGSDGAAPSVRFAATSPGGGGEGRRISERSTGNENRRELV